MYNLTFFCGIFLISALMSCDKKNNNNIANIDFDKSYTVKSNYDASTKNLNIDIELKDGVHAYGEQEKVGKPVRLIIEENNGWKANGKAIIPKGYKRSFKGAQENFLLEGSFRIKQPLVPGKDQGRAILYLQVCTDTQCDRPRSHELSFN